MNRKRSDSDPAAFSAASGAPPAPANAACLTPCSFSQRATCPGSGSGSVNFMQRLRTVGSSRSGCVLTSRKTVPGGGSSRLLSSAFCVFAFMASAG